MDETCRCARFRGLSADPAHCLTRSDSHPTLPKPDVLSTYSAHLLCRFDGPGQRRRKRSKLLPEQLPITPAYLADALPAISSSPSRIVKFQERRRFPLPPHGIIPSLHSSSSPLRLSTSFLRNIAGLLSSSVVIELAPTVSDVRHHDQGRLSGSELPKSAPRSPLAHAHSST